MQREALKPKHALTYTFVRARTNAVWSFETKACTDTLILRGPELMQPAALIPKHAVTHCLLGVRTHEALIPRQCRVPTTALSSIC